MSSIYENLTRQKFIREEDQRKISYYPPSNGSDIMIEIEAGDYSWEVNDLHVKKPTIKVGEKICRHQKVTRLQFVGQLA